MKTLPSSLATLPAPAAGLAAGLAPIPTHDRPCAAPGLISYRYRLPYGENRFVMIGATDDANALSEARRSYDKATAAGLERWGGNDYRPICPPHLAHVSLGDLEYFYREGRVSMADLLAYLRAWNATPGRFTQALWRGTEAHGRIVQLDPEELTPAGRELHAQDAAKCGADLGPAPATPPPRAIELETTNDSGSHDSRHDRYFANGKRITREQHNAIRRASVRLTEERSYSSAGKWTFYRTAYVPADRADVLAVAGV